MTPQAVNNLPWPTTSVQHAERPIFHFPISICYLSAYHPMSDNNIQSGSRYISPYNVISYYYKLSPISYGPCTIAWCRAQRFNASYIYITRRFTCSAHIYRSCMRTLHTSYYRLRSSASILLSYSPDVVSPQVSCRVRSLCIDCAS